MKVVSSLLFASAFLFPPAFNLRETASKMSPYKELRESAVHLMVGSGSVVKARSGKAFMLTNFHVCIDAKIDGVVVGSYNNGHTIMGPVVDEDAISDLCLIDIKQSVPALSVASDMKFDETIYTRGWPHGILGEYEGKATSVTDFEWIYSIDEMGECPSRTKKVYGHNGRLAGCQVRSENVVTTLYAAPGSSGSPVVNQSGKLVGVIESHLHSGSGTNKGNAGLVPLKDIQEMLKRH